MTLRDDLLPMLESVRSIPGDLGLRLFRVFIRTTTYSGDRVGVGTPTQTETEILTGGHPPKVKERRGEDIVGGHSEMRATEYEVGPIQPDFLGGGNSTDVLDPAAGAAVTKIVYVVKGPGLPASGVLCEKTGDGFDSTLHYSLTLKAIGRAGA